VLKEYNIISTGPSAPRGFEKEVSILSKLNHPLIIKIEAVFYDGIHVYALHLCLLHHLSFFPFTSYGFLE
jgi:serine/threonine protein kinase